MNFNCYNELSKGYKITAATKRKEYLLNNRLNLTDHNKIHRPNGSRHIQKGMQKPPRSPILQINSIDVHFPIVRNTVFAQVPNPAISASPTMDLSSNLQWKSEYQIFFPPLDALEK